MSKLRSYKNRAPHLGGFPLEDLPRIAMAALSDVPPMQPLSFDHTQDPLSILPAMRDYQAMMDATRDGLVKNRSPKFHVILLNGRVT